MGSGASALQPTATYSLPGILEELAKFQAAGSTNITGAQLEAIRPIVLVHDVAVAENGETQGLPTTSFKVSREHPRPPACTPRLPHPLRLARSSLLHPLALSTDDGPAQAQRDGCSSRQKQRPHHELVEDRRVARRLGRSGYVVGSSVLRVRR